MFLTRTGSNCKLIRFMEKPLIKKANVICFTFSSIFVLRFFLLCQLLIVHKFIN